MPLIQKDRESNVITLTEARERGDITRKYYERLHVTRPLVDRLCLEKELVGHMGCVNCLEWNVDGSILASASDDLHINLWDPYRYNRLHNIKTGHTGNIFSVKFLTPGIVASSAGDHTVRVHEIVNEDGAIRLCRCHCGRVKRLATAPDAPMLFWSAGEDGLVIQHDLREPHNCNSENNNVLVNLVNNLGRYAEAKCIAVNPRRAEQIAVGANDFFVRLYDRRMIRLSGLKVEDRGRMNTVMPTEDNVPRECVHYFAPGHLSTDTHDHTFPKKATTYVSFSNSGDELLVNIGSEQIYLYNINSSRRPQLLKSFIIEHNNNKNKNGVTAGDKVETSASNLNGTTCNGKVGLGYDAWSSLPSEIIQLKDMAHECLNHNQFFSCIEFYNTAISLCKTSASLYSNRATALMRRGWPGDVYAAIQDCYTAISIDSKHVKSHFRLAKALMELKKPREAYECLRYFKEKFPQHVNSHAVALLKKDIDQALGNMAIVQADEDTEDNINIGSNERHLRATAIDYTSRFVGHCNTTTDIKEAIFLGHDASFIAAGSDDGNMFIWCRETGNIIRCLHGDNSIVNCIQMHPTLFLLATSGIEATVKLWSPAPEDGRSEPRLVASIPEAAEANQKRMRADPFEAMLLNITYPGFNQPDQPRDMLSPPCSTS